MNFEQLFTQGNKLICSLQGLNVAYLGISMGIFEALHRSGGSLSLEGLQEKTGVDPEYLKRFCLAAYAFGFIERKDSLYFLSSLGSLFVEEQTKSKTLPLVFQSVFYPLITTQISKFSKAGGHIHAFPPFEDPEVFPYMWTMMEYKFSSLFQQEILPRLSFIEEIERQGGIVVDVGCGNGWLLRRLLSQFEKLRGIGIDSNQEGIAQAQAASSSFKERVQFVAADFFEYPLPQEVSLFTFSRVLHHLWSERSKLVQKLKSYLKPHLRVLVWEPIWPADIEQLREENMKSVAFQNLHENVEGNFLLEEKEIKTFLEECGLTVQQFMLENGIDSIFVGSKD
ncbi:class I SAM-dependent methyltransferase [Methylacidiphilum caldifontis]|uniref:class I SAM-dependent methyltransferase n=1 Tax=Methylacidiphilum caldifontis TaxID=2795386 RepID=UPI001A905BBF|nr:class I SAM-dependent methyltransferase [Methylacidiphilum caldifontis]QSR89590.1 class I SAM-dependent methyltransferase [Methylacidiphilum caldifontis]